MFQLSNEIVKNYIGKANKIHLYYYMYKNDILNIYNTRFEYDKNIIPLAISIFEKQPILFNRKKIIMLDSDIIFYKYHNQGYELKKDFFYPSFYHDIEKFSNEKKNIHIYKKNLKTLDTGKALIMFTCDNINNNYNQIDIHNFEEYEEIVLNWSWDYISIDFIIDKLFKNIQIEITIDMNEDKKLINNKIQTVNELIKKCDKILNHINYNG